MCLQKLGSIGYQINLLNFDLVLGVCILVDFLHFLDLVFWVVWLGCDLYVWGWWWLGCVLVGSGSGGG